MLPWLFVVLILLNAGLFFWGYQREKSLEPELPPLPEGQYEIRLTSEPQPDEADGEAGNHLESPAAEAADAEAELDSPEPERSVPKVVHEVTEQSREIQIEDLSSDELDAEPSAEPEEGITALPTE